MTDHEANASAHDATANADTLHFIIAAAHRALLRHPDDESAVEIARLLEPYAAGGSRALTASYDDMVTQRDSLRDQLAVTTEALQQATEINNRRREHQREQYQQQNSADPYTYLFQPDTSGRWVAASLNAYAHILDHRGHPDRPHRLWRIDASRPPTPTLEPVELQETLDSTDGHVIAMRITDPDTTQSALYWVPATHDDDPDWDNP